ncbi:MAG: FAD-binding protein [Chloroflexi bacterium]|nr:FAD-binding protein [Chloroflexota bacterium]
MKHRQSETDVIVIGSGASGAAVTWSLDRAGFQVICIEQGPWVDPAMFPVGQDDWHCLQSRSDD